MTCQEDFRRAIAEHANERHEQLRAQIAEFVCERIGAQIRLTTLDRLSGHDLDALASAIDNCGG